MRAPGLLGIALAALLASGCGRDEASHEVAVPWALGGQWLVGDMHTHTGFSDGALKPAELVSLALANGCQVLAITDHGDPQTRGATPEFFAEVKALRARHPKLVLFAGMEWNIPPHGGQEHVTVLVDPGLEEATLTEFKQRFERKDAVAQEAFKWLQGRLQGITQAAMIYNHPTRVARGTADQALQDMLQWRAATPLMIGFEGAPGHQNAKVPGAYQKGIPTEHRWDVVAARVGGAWDVLLDRGHGIWAALSTSDYHNTEYDHPPCAFSRTLFQVPERSPAGVLKALHAGSYWGMHGNFLEHLMLTVAAPGLALPASPGEVIRYRTGGSVRVHVALQRAAPGVGALTAEIIGNCRTGAPETLATLQIDAKQDAAETPLAGLTRGGDGASCYLRLRVRKKAQDGDDWLAYTNPVRIRLN